MGTSRPPGETLRRLRALKALAYSRQDADAYWCRVGTSRNQGLVAAGVGLRRNQNQARPRGPLGLRLRRAAERRQDAEDNRIRGENAEAY